MSEAKDKKEIDHILKEFAKCTLALCDVLHREPPLDAMERLFIDNHIQVLQMVYLQWNRKNKAPIRLGILKARNFCRQGSGGLDQAGSVPVLSKPFENQALIHVPEALADW